MRAVGIMVHGGPEVLKVLTVAVVHAGPGDVRVRVHAAAVNPTDTMARNGSRAAQQKVDPPPNVPPRPEGADPATGGLRMRRRKPPPPNIRPPAPGEASGCNAVVWHAVGFLWREPRESLKILK